jgi:hypothetical protein
MYTEVFVCTQMVYVSYAASSEHLCISVHCVQRSTVEHALLLYHASTADCTY